MCFYEYKKYLVDLNVRTVKLPLFFSLNNQNISDPMVIANRFCSYFSNIGPNLAKQIPALSWIPSYFRTGNFMNTIFFEPVSQLEILEIVKSFRSVTAAACGQ